MTFNNSVAPVIVDANCDQTARDLVSICWDALRESNVTIPTHLRFGEKQLLVKNSNHKISVVQCGSGEYHFIYRAYDAAGAESSTFASANFTLEPVV